MFYIYANGRSIYQPLDPSRVLFQPKLTLEMGKAGSFQFNIPPTHPYYDQMLPLTTEIVVEMDDRELFRGRVLNNSVNFNRMRQVYCEGNLAYLVDSVQKNEKFDGKAHDFFRRLIANHNARMKNEKQFQVGQITVENRDVIVSGQSNVVENAETGKFDYDQIIINATTTEWETTYDYIDQNLLSYTGGYLRTRRENGVDYIDLLKEYGRTATQTIRFGRNLLDYTSEVKVDDLFTVLIPLGDENLTIASVNGGSDEIVDAERVAQYGRIVKTHAFENVRNPQTLLENARRFLENNGKDEITVQVKAVDIHFLDPNTIGIFVGDKVRIESVPHGMSDTITCMKIEYDIENPANNTYTFGTPKQTLTERYRKDKQKKSGGGGGGAPTDELDETLKKDREEWQSYIGKNEEVGTVTLFGLYQKYSEDKVLLKKKSGIDLDVDDVGNNVNIYTFNDRLNEETGQRELMRAAITEMANDNKAQIDAVVSQTNGKFAELTLKVENDSSEIAMKADKVTVDAQFQATQASINQLNAKIASIDSLIATKINAALMNAAGITAVAGNFSSSLSVGGKQVATREYVETVWQQCNERFAKKTDVPTESTLDDYATKTYVDNKHTTAMNEIAKYPTKEWCNNQYSRANHVHIVPFKTDPKVFKSTDVSANKTHSFSIATIGQSVDLQNSHTHQVTINANITTGKPTSP